MGKATYFDPKTPPYIVDNKGRADVTSLIVTDIFYIFTKISRHVRTISRLLYISLCYYFKRLKITNHKSHFTNGRHAQFS